MKIPTIGIFFLVLISLALVVNAATFSGYTYNTTEGALNNTNVTIEVWQQNPFSVVATYSNLTNASGYWTLGVPDGQLTGNMVKFIPRHYTSQGYADYVGSVLPAFPYSEISNMLNISNIVFYLKAGATINVTALNQSGDGPKNFTYMVKDTKLGFDVASNWQTSGSQATIYLPADRNYSIEIFPTESMPVYYELNNISAYSTPSIDVIFNTTTDQIRVSGRINLSSQDNGTDFDEFNIINYLMEPGGMVFSSMPMPYNISSWYGGTDVFNATTGEYNISLEGTSMTTKVLMFAYARKGNQYYGSFRNVTPAIGNNITDFNFTLYPLLGSVANISINSGMGSQLKFPVNQTLFAFVNSTGSTLTTATGHVEIQLQYSNLDSDMPDFTWMADVSRDGGGTFNLPLLNYSVKKLNMFTQDYAPRKLSFTASQLEVPQVNITLTAFNPGGIGEDDFEGIQMRMIRSSAACDVPDFDFASCSFSGGDLGGTKDEEDFKPLNALVSGAPLSLIIMKGNIMVHYINVDMLASGPPDALFDNSSASSTSGSSLQEAWRFGSLGPEIYDSLIVAFPYSATIDDSQDLNISIPVLYDNDWNVIWNTSVNGTTGIGGNLTDYSTYNESWFSGINCSKTDKSANCFINTSMKVMWIRIPHFSGVGPSVTGSASSSGSSSTSSGGGSTTSLTQIVTLTELTTTYSGLEINSILQFSLGGNSHSIKVSKVYPDRTKVDLIISSEPILITLSVGEEKTIDVGENEQLYIKLEGIKNSEADLTVKKIPLKTIVLPEPTEEPVKQTTEDIPVVKPEETIQQEVKKPNMAIMSLVIIALVIVVGLAGYLVYLKKKV